MLWDLGMKEVTNPVILFDFYFGVLKILNEVNISQNLKLRNLIFVSHKKTSRHLKKYKLND